MARPGLRPLQPPAMRADYFRLCFMLRVGGLYIDADDEHQGADVESMISGALLRRQPLVYDIHPTRWSAGRVRLRPPGWQRGSSTSTTTRSSQGPRWNSGTGDHLLLAANETNGNIQSLTGPGNLKTSLVAHAARLKADAQVLDFELLTIGTQSLSASGRPPTDPTFGTGGTGSAA